MSSTFRSYWLDLPCFQAGDDFTWHLEHAKGNLPQAFKELARTYEEAAKMCHRMASVCFENGDVDACGDVTQVVVDGPVEVLQPLVGDGVLDYYDIDSYAAPSGSWSTDVVWTGSEGLDEEDDDYPGADHD